MIGPFSSLPQIPADLITLDPTHVLKVDRADQEVLSAEQKAEQEANHAHRKARERVRARGKGRAQKVVAQRLAAKERLRRVRKVQAVVGGRPRV